MQFGTTSEGKGYVYMYLAPQKPLLCWLYIAGVSSVPALACFDKDINVYPLILSLSLSLSPHCIQLDPTSLHVVTSQTSFGR